jgi:hypothetical protein
LNVWLRIAVSGWVFRGLIGVGCFLGCFRCLVGFSVFSCVAFATE